MLTLVVVAGLVVLGVWGHRQGWKIPRPGATAEVSDGEKKTEEPAGGKKDDDDGPAPPPRDASPDSFDQTRVPTHDPARCPYVGKPIRLKDHEALERTGITVTEVGARDLTEQVEAGGTLEFLPTGQARISARAAGVVWWLAKTPGELVRPGELLALVESPDVGKAKSDFLQARVHVQSRKQALSLLQEGPGAPRQTVQTAESALREAQAALTNAENALANLGLPIEARSLDGQSDADAAQDLRFLGLPKELPKKLADRLTPSLAPANLLPVFAPPEFAGRVLAVDAVEGETVPAMQPFLRLANTDRLVVRLDVPAEDAGRLRPGQAVEFRPDGDAGSPATGKVAWISPALDERTRTVAVRAEVENADGRLRAHSFGTGRVTLRQTAGATVVPRGAVQWEGCSHVVFVRGPQSELEFTPRRVKLGLTQGEVVQVLDGLKPGETVVLMGSHVLKTELFKDRLGEGE